jgi:hypothetical protein
MLGSMPFPPGTSAATFSTVYDITSSGVFDTVASFFSGYTVVSKILPANFLATGGTARLTIYGPQSGSGTLNAVWGGPVAASGNAYNFLSGSQAQFLFSGSGSLSMTAGGVYVSDSLTVNVTPGVAFLIAMNVASSTAMARRHSLPAGYINYFLAASAEAATAAKSAGYGVQTELLLCTFKLEAA